MIPGEFILKDEEITCNADRPNLKITVINTGDRPVQVGSHFHFYEVNTALKFSRKEAYGKRLNVPAGAAVRFEPGDEKEVELIDYAGERKVYGFNNKVDGLLESGDINEF
ncbi:urease subunit beta [Oceanobacillus damuensis]|uniref:urease subunit beta n=1 Tax=Oceanobacillus damuensis TaxID=937928 RepID=UPI000830DBD0|nr:urease subunit beta [Oceanobacillus damuensis]